MLSVPSQGSLGQVDREVEQGPTVRGTLQLRGSPAAFDPPFDSSFMTPLAWGVALAMSGSDTSLGANLNRAPGSGSGASWQARRWPQGRAGRPVPSGAAGTAEGPWHPFFTFPSLGLWSQRAGMPGF